MVAMVPSFISALITSAAFTDMRCASSPTVMVSGTAISRTIGSVGCAKRGLLAAELRRRCRPPPRRMPAADAAAGVAARLDRAPARGVVAQDRGRLCLLRLLVGLGVAGAGLGACSVVAGAAGRGAAAAPRPPLAFCSASLALALLLFAQLGRLQLGELLLAPRLFLAQLDLLGVDRCGQRGAAGGGGGGGGASAATAAAVTSAGSRLTKTRFLRTSTCTVRYLPVASVFLISLVCLRVSVILFFCSAEPCALRRYSSSRDLSARRASRRAASSPRRPRAAARAAPKAGPSARSRIGRRWSGPRYAASLLVVVGEPVGARGHDQLLGRLGVHAGHLGKLVDREVGEVVARLDAASRPAWRRAAVSMPSSFSSSGSTPSIFSSLAIAATSSALRARVRSSFTVSSSNDSISHQLVDRHVGDLLQRREAFLDQDVGDFLVDVELLHEVLP